jgi:hypothetical protein
MGLPRIEDVNPEIIAAELKDTLIQKLLEEKGKKEDSKTDEEA